MKYTSHSTTKTTVKVFDITDVEPVQIGYWKTPTLIEQCVVTYVEGKDGLRKTSCAVRGRNVVKDGTVGQQDREVWSYHFKAANLTWPQEIADKNAPWVVTA